jgi:hypothetical protein
MTRVRVFLGWQQTFGSVTKVRSRYNKTFAELMDNLRGEAGKRLTALSGPCFPLKRRRFRLQTKSAT